tara:strand:+ start:1845 stop:2915 length:1071 start_codon:yes stop_codon:yes gene_type:complete
MLNNRTELIKQFINEGFTHRTLSLFSDGQLKELSKKIFTEEVTDTEIDNAKKNYSDLLATKAAELVDEEDEMELTPNNEPVVKVKKDGEKMTLLGDGEVTEGERYVVNQAAADQLESKEGDEEELEEELKPAKAQKMLDDGKVHGNSLTKKQKKYFHTVANEQKMLEEWILGLVESKQTAEISKGNFLKTIKENLSLTDDTVKNSPYTIGTEAQQDSFANVVEIAREMVPPMTVNVDGFDDDGHVNGYLNAPETNQIIDLNICPAGDIKLDGNPVGSMELSETERDNDGEYIGVPTSTTAPVKPAPVKPVTRPGEKTRRGPFEKPKTTPKPKARKKGSLPDWLSSTNLGKSLTQHG